MGIPDDTILAKDGTLLQVEIDGCVIHRWKRATDNWITLHCDSPDCSHETQPDEKFYLALYPEDQTETYCLECAAFFMAQAIDYFLRRKNV